MKSISLLASLALAASLSMLSVEAGRLPSYMRGLYLLLSDRDMWVKNNQGQSVPSNQYWTPRVSSWIHQFNVVFFTFIDHDMKVPPSFESARTSGQFAAGTKIIYSLAGDGYSQDIAAWKSTFSNPKALASQVAQWKCDGIDIDFENGIGADFAFSANLVIFVQELRRLRPDFIITQAVFGWPQVISQSLLTVKSWTNTAQSNNLLDSVGIMVYENADSLKYVDLYTGDRCA